MSTFSVTGTSALSEPRTTATATTSSIGFLDGAALAAYGHAGGCWYLYVVIRHRNNRKAISSHYLVMQLHVIGLELTFAGRHAIGPPVINMFVSGTATVLEPSTARSATTVSA